MKTNLLKSIFISLILLVGATNAWAANISANTYFYYDNSTLKWTNSCIQLMVGHSSWSQGYQMTKISNTNLYYVKMPKWDGATQIAVFGTDAVWGGEGSSITSRKSWAPNSTSVLSLSANLSGSRLLTVNSSATLSNSSLSDYTALNTDQKAVVQSNASGSYKDDANAGTVSISTYKLSSETDAASSTGTTSASAARTASVSMTATAKTGYTFVGWYNSSGTRLTTNVEYTYTCSGSTATYYARFEENTYSVTINNDGHGTTSPSGEQSNVGQVTGVSIDATPTTNYEFVNWTIVSGNGTFDSDATNASNKFYPTSTATIQANFRSTATNSLTVVAGAGIESVTGSTDPVTLGNPCPITATPKTGYTFSTWTANPAANATFGSATTANTTVTVKNGSVTVTASATENMSTLTTSNKYDAGDPGYADPTKSVNSIGVTTTATINATAAEEGYTFAGWELTNCVRTDGGDETATSIIVKSNGDGKAATVEAKYEEDLTSEWHLVGNGNIFPDGWNINNTSMMQKISGKSTEDVVAMKINVTTVQTYEFKIVDDNGSESDTWYGYSTGNTFLIWTATGTKNVYSGDNNANNLKFTPNVAGEYEFKVDYSGTYPTVTITYPTIYTVTYSRTPTAAADAPTTSPSVTSGKYVAAGTEVTFTAQNAKTGYTWKGWYDNNSGTGEALSTDKVYTRSITENTTIYAVYTAKTSKVTLNPQPGEGGTTSVNATTGSAMPDIEIPTRHGYTFGGYYDQEAGNGTQYYNESGKSAKDWDKEGDVTLYAKWTATPYTITYNTNGGNAIANGSYTIEEAFILPTPTKIGSTFEGWFDNSELTGDAITTIASGSTGNKVFWAKWNIGTYDVTLDMEGGNGGTTSVQVTHGTAMPTITIPTKNDHLFDGYYDGDNGTGTKYYNADGTSAKNWDKETATLYARWIPYTQCIFFKNNLDWNDVYVYTFTADPWDGWVGVLVKDKYLEYGKMTQIGQTDVYYYVLTNKTTGFQHIAFSETDMHTYEKFYQSKAINRADRDDKLPLFIPEKDQIPSTTNSTKYYSSGIWMKYNSTESGYEWKGATSEDSNDAGWNNAFQFVADKPGGYSFTATVEFTNTNKHFFKVRNLQNVWFGNGGTMTQTNCTNWTFGSDNSSNAKITPTVTGEYTFHLYLGDGYVQVSLDFPLSVGDYRLAYKDNTAGSHHPGHYLKKHSSSQTDTVSFFIHHDQQPEIIVEKCTKITDGVPTWAKVTEITNNPAASVTEDGVYNFYLQQIDGKTNPTLVNKADPYRGNYYIRTDAADGGWKNFRQKSNQITYSSFADSHSNFNHYYCKYIDAGRNVKFTIANDYSYCISDTLDNDAIIQPNQSSVGCLPPNKEGSANVRFGWDSNTNEISRAYIKGAGITSDRFLVLQGNEHLKDANGNPIPKGEDDRTGLEANEEILVDQQNWIYQVDVTANKNTFIKLVADYNGTTQYFKGDAGNYTQLLSSTASKDYKIRLVYDFKSNHLVTAWLAAGDTIQGELVLGADMMVIRTNQEKADQLNFNPTSSSLGNVGIGYAVMKFTKAHLENLKKDNKTPLPENEKKTERERSLYWVSFPFDVKISDVFGFGEYAEHWILQYYDGAERAEKGLFSDSGTYWKYIEDTKTTLEAGTGYVLALDLSKVEFLYGATEVSLYFPSADSLKTITGKLPTADTVPAHECTIDRKWTENEGTQNEVTYHHKYTDSHWNLIGVPGFADITEFDVTGNEFVTTDLSFYYEFDLSRSEYNVTPGSTDFKAMYAYMVQFAGIIDWSLKSVNPVAPPAAIAARRYSDERPEKVVLRLELAQGQEVADRTFVQLQQEGATANFDLSLDLTKIVNKGANIYTLTDSLKIQVAGNVLPFEETTVAVGVEIAAAGEYTFRMPDGTEGMVVELIDYELETTTNLLLFDYTVTLPKGTSEDRFALHIQPSKSGVTTGVGNVGDEAKGIEKYLIDGKLIIRTAEGVVYDAQGHRL